MLKHLFLAVALGFSLSAGAEYDEFQAEKGGHGPRSEVTTITITIVLSPSFEETTRMCESKSLVAGCSYTDEHGNQIIIIPAAEGWDDYYSLCIAGHELYHAIGANHAVAIGCPYPYVDEDEVEEDEASDKDKRSKN